MRIHPKPQDEVDARNIARVVAWERDWFTVSQGNMAAVERIWSLVDDVAVFFNRGPIGYGSLSDCVIVSDKAYLQKAPTEAFQNILRPLGTKIHVSRVLFLVRIGFAESVAQRSLPPFFFYATLLGNSYGEPSSFYGRAIRVDFASLFEYIASYYFTHALGACEMMPLLEHMGAAFAAGYLPVAWDGQQLTVYVEPPPKSRTLRKKVS
jgi:hypothetical protein